LLRCAGNDKVPTGETHHAIANHCLFAAACALMGLSGWVLLLLLLVQRNP